MRGQAFVIMDNKEQAKEALTNLQGFSLYEKKMRIKYAREKSYNFLLH